MNPLFALVKRPVPVHMAVRYFRLYLYTGVVRIRTLDPAEYLCSTVVPSRREVERSTVHPWL